MLVHYSASVGMLRPSSFKAKSWEEEKLSAVRHGGDDSGSPDNGPE